MKVGRIGTTRRFLDEVEILKLLYTKITPYKIVPDSDNTFSDLCTIYAYSDEFDEVKDGGLIPLYEATFVLEGDAYTVSIDKSHPV